MSIHRQSNVSLRCLVYWRILEKCRISLKGKLKAIKKFIEKYQRSGMEAALREYSGESYFRVSCRFRPIQDFHEGLEKLY